MQNYAVCYKHFDVKDYSPCLHRRVLLNIAIPVPSEIYDINIISNNTQNILPQKQEQLQFETTEKHSQNTQCTNNKDVFSEDEIFNVPDAVITNQEIHINGL